MLSAIIFAIRMTGLCLQRFLDTNVPFTDNVTLKIYHIIVFLFILPMLLKLMYTIMNDSVQVSNKK